MQTLLQDLRYSLRRLRKSPGFTLIAILSLALGIGANTAIFSLVNTALLRPLPLVERPQEIVSVYGTFNNGAGDTLFSYPNYKDLRDRNDVFTGLLAYRFAPLSLSHQGNNERIWGYLVSGNYFDVLGAKPLLGRTFLPEEDKTRKSHPVAVLSFGAWQKRFASDPNMVGKTVLVNGHSFTIVGVMPKDFVGTEVAYVAELFVPFAMAEVIEPSNDYVDCRDCDNIFVAGRLKPGVTPQQAEAGLEAALRQLAQEHPRENEGRGVRVLTVGLFLPSIRAGVTSFSWVLMVVVGLVLLIACVNLANLLLARATERKKEIAVRLALGASRWRLLRQLLTESVLLSIFGGAFGLLLAYFINDFVAKIQLPTDVTLTFDLRIDGRVLLFALGMSVLTGVLFGLLPALQATRPDLVPALKDDVSVSGFRRAWLRNSLVVAQMALSVLLLICAGLIVRSLQAAQTMRPGFNPENAVAMMFDVGLQGYDEARGRAFHKQVLERVRALPGVKSASLAMSLPLGLNFNNNAIYIEGTPKTSSANMPIAVANFVMPDYFTTMGIALRGRDFNERDKEKESRVVIVNETFARRFWPGQEAIGKRFNFSGPDDPLWEIIGIAADGKYESLGEEQKIAFYRPMLRDYITWTTLVARTAGEPTQVLNAMRNEIRKLDATLPVSGVKTLQEHMNVPLFPARVAATILGSFGVLALILAAIGIYGVMSYAVAQRTREIGIRMALGALQGDVLKMVVGQGLQLVGIGLAIGLGAAFGLTRFLAVVLYGVSATDVVTFVAIPILLAGVAFLACFLPAQRAAKVDPIQALRYE
ncbi:MAG TPA: ABC transporter permease [Blastocatellia bacterium]|nr:ABC transporter permease [Blastocatellia bacterium]